MVVWWDSCRIQATVTRQFVCSHLLPEEIERLDRPLAFGDGLTDGTYWEWIDEKAKRIFLILLDLGVPDQVFGLVDDSWDDDDLPIPLDQIERLDLTATKDDKVEKKFYARQFLYLLKFVEKGDHVVYEDPQVPPIDVVDKRAGLSLNSVVDRVELPNRPGEILARRRIPIRTGPGALTEEEFAREISQTRNIENGHLVSYFASYTHRGQGYVLFTLPSDFSLKSLLVTMPGSVKSLAKQDRRNMLMNWIHCLVDTLCYLHSRGLSHGNIKPSTILFNTDNHIFFADTGRLSMEAIGNTSEKPTFDKESYDYAAPEQWYRPSPTHSAPHRRSTLVASSPSTSSNNSTFSGTRGSSDGNHSGSTFHPHTPSLNAQAADIFSLGCVMLEILSLLMKRQTRAFASHRAAKHKQAGRGGAVLDSSFHKNLGQVESWMAGLAKDASKKEDLVFRGAEPMLQVVARMLSMAPHERPTAREVEQFTYRILTENCQITEPHCVHQYGGWDFGMGGLNISRGSDDFTIGTTATMTAATAIRRYSGSSRQGSYRPASRRPPSSSSAWERGVVPGEGSSSGSSNGSGFRPAQNTRTGKAQSWQSYMCEGSASSIAGADST
ncbi:kinase-like domain-containing protein [Durotheca rogersii]|uniref:kinase-like domain-containing protein n=1 Tax=Durotheca rogersii TaxID=419775 RepID=UPI0022211966|nr:kinase-like domain-containing protein [Durotheca rogersii]KAI5863508.1 kinase-like domain-containing protein [Durotheca rogersii]